MKLHFTKFYNQIVGDYVCLDCFTETTLIPTCYIPVNALECCLKYGVIHIDIEVVEKVNDEYKRSKDRYKLSDLIDECPEVREYVRIYFPEHYI